jgi:hypothetical protein
MLWLNKINLIYTPNLISFAFLDANITDDISMVVTCLSMKIHFLFSCHFFLLLAYKDTHKSDFFLRCVII